MTTEEPEVHVEVEGEQSEMKVEDQEDVEQGIEMDEGVENSQEKKSLEQGRRKQGGKGNSGLTLANMQKDKVMKLARKHWAHHPNKPPPAPTAPASAAKKLKKGKTDKSPGKGEAGAAAREEAGAVCANAPGSLDAALVAQLYREELGGGEAPALPRVVLLELSQYLENYLWPHFDPETASVQHVLSIVAMVNEKFREGVPAWACFHQDEALFPKLMSRILAIKKEHTFSVHEATTYLLFFIHCFQSLEDAMVRTQLLPLVSLPLWRNLSAGRLQLELKHNPSLEKHWRHLQKKEAKAAKLPGYTPPEHRPETWFIPTMVSEFLEFLEVAVVPAEEPGSADDVDAGMLLYAERFLELLSDLLSQLPTRRFVRAFLEDTAVLTKCRLAPIHAHPRGRLFSQLTDLFMFYQGFQIHDHTGAHLADEEMDLMHAERVQQLQRLAFRHIPKLMELSLSTVGTLEKRATLEKYLNMLDPDELYKLATQQLRLLSPEDPWAQRLDCLKEVLVSTYERKPSQRQAVNELPLYPTETVLWDEHMVPSVNYTGQGVLALPKLNMQFLTFHDYLLRNFNLFRLEATYEIREDMRDVLRRIKPVLVEGDDDTPDAIGFKGWARMALPTKSFAVTEVSKPKVGETKPAQVLADIVIDTSGLFGEARFEWDQLKQHDVLFLLSMVPPEDVLEGDEARPAEERAGLKYVRGCELVEMRDEQGKLMNDFTGRVRADEQGPPAGSLRTVTVALDTAQYQLDANASVATGAEDVYKTVNVVMRRKPKENNFKAILECIRDLMNEQCAVPEWLHDIFLGYGDPAAAHYSQMPGRLQTVTFKDTFIDKEHLEQSFPDKTIKFVGDAELKPPFKVTFPAPRPEMAAAGKKRKGKGAGADVAGADETGADVAAEEPLLVESVIPPIPGPYEQDQPRLNSVRFTPTQVEAIRAGVNPGLTMVVGPPGTGKTDVAVQIMNELYSNFPQQRTLVITHSNHALNDLFVKIMERDIPARYLLRLGMGEQELDTDIDFSRAGRVNSMLARRLQLLAEVEKLARTLGIMDDVGYTCETANHFWLLHVYSRWEEFLFTIEQKKKEATPAPSVVKNLFPFTEYFKSAPQPIFKEQTLAEDMRHAWGCFRHLRIIFQELEECRGFEIMKNQGDRSKLLLTKQAKIVAMTCTHAAMKRAEFLKLGFRYDNLLMEESAQILEIETFIPMLLQRQQDGASRLKRVILIGDHHQLPPVVKNMAFQKYSRMDQSLFTRFVRLGTPLVELNRQGRARASLATLYTWRYRDLQNLPRVQEHPMFSTANAGFVHDFQFVDVPDWEGVGESEPSPHFYQNLGEAEYLVTVYQYMRLLGYPAKKISIITSYRGQKHLIRDVINARCANNPLFGKPAKVTTVDKFQGQQNDFVLLSLVRTRSVGHIRDVRRLVVACSRARLGLYIFGRRQLFENCYELAPTFRTLLARPDKLALLPTEKYPTTRKPDDKVAPYLVDGLPIMNVIVNQLTQKWQAQQVAAIQQAEMQAGGARGGRSDNKSGGGGRGHGKVGEMQATPTKIDTKTDSKAITGTDTPKDSDMTDV